MQTSFIHSRVFPFVPLYNAFRWFPFITFMYPKFLFDHFPNITYSTFFIILIVFPVLLLQRPLFRLPHVISSNQFPVVFPVRRSSHFSNSWWVISLVFLFSDVTFSVFLSSWLFPCFPFPILRMCIVFFQFSASCFTHVMYANSVKFQIFYLFVFALLLLFQFPFFLSIVSEFSYRLSILLGIPFKM